MVGREHDYEHGGSSGRVVLAFLLLAFRGGSHYQLRIPETDDRVDDVRLARRRERGKTTRQPTLYYAVRPGGRAPRVLALAQPHSGWL